MVMVASRELFLPPSLPTSPCVVARDLPTSSANACAEKDNHNRWGWRHLIGIRLPTLLYRGFACLWEEASEMENPLYCSNCRHGDVVGYMCKLIVSPITVNATVSLTTITGAIAVPMWCYSRTVKRDLQKVRGSTLCKRWDFGRAGVSTITNATIMVTILPVLA